MVYVIDEEEPESRQKESQPDPIEVSSPKVD